MVAGIQLELAEVLVRRGRGRGGAADDDARARQLRAEGLAIARRLELGGLLARYGDRATPPRVGWRGGRGRARAAAPTTARAARRRAGAASAFYRRGDIWTIGRPGREIQLRDAKGLAHIARLLAAPHVEFHALDLVGGVTAERGQRRRRSPSARASRCARAARATPGPALDNQAKAAYRARVGELQEEIDEAESFNDPERAARAREELEFVARELAGAVGLHGRDRKTGSDAERARVNVTRAIRTALKRVSEHDAALGRRLGAAIRTGTFCVYEPAPGEAPAWDLEGPG